MIDGDEFGESRGLGGPTSNPYSVQPTDPGAQGGRGADPPSHPHPCRQGDARHGMMLNPHSSASRVYAAASDQQTWFATYQPRPFGEFEDVNASYGWQRPTIHNGGRPLLAHHAMPFRELDLDITASNGNSDAARLTGRINTSLAHEAEEAHRDPRHPSLGDVTVIQPSPRGMEALEAYSESYGGKRRRPSQGDLRELRGRSGRRSDGQLD